MPVLSDPKLEVFCRFLLRNIAKGMAKGKAADGAAADAGYTGSSLSANARKRANRRDVKARMAEMAEELATPEQKQARAELAIDLATAEQRLWAIITADIKPDETVMPKDVVNAFKAIAAVRGWNAPTKIDLNKHVSTDWSTDELVAFLADAEARLAGDQAPDRGAVEPDQVH